MSIFTGKTASFSDAFELRAPDEPSSAPDLLRAQFLADHTYVTAPREVGRCDHRFDFERQDVLPALSLTDARQAASSVLADAHASSQDKLLAVEVLARSGIKHLTVKDADGTQRTLRLELEQAGRRTLVHMFAPDDSGKERIVLRGIANGDGTYAPERDRSGRTVGLAGDFWSSNMGHRSGLAGVAGQPDDAGSSARREDLKAALGSIAPGPQPCPDIPDPPRPHRPGPYDPGPDRPGPFRPDRPPTRPDLPDLPETSGRSELELRQYFDALTGDARPARGVLQKLSSGVVFRYGKAKIDADGWQQGSRRIDPFYSPHTSLRYPDGSSVDANVIPYMVLPSGKYAQYGIRKGDIGIVERDGRLVPVVFADVGSYFNQGEVSMAAARALGINPHPRYGGTDDYRTRYIIFPNSGDGTPQTPQAIRQKAFQLLSAYGRRGLA